MKKQFFLVLAALFGVIGLNTVRADYQYPTGAVRGVFTVAPGTQVVFAQGNLQYTASTDEWRFATNQYDIIGEANKSIGKNTYGGAIDLFGWGTGANPLKYDCTSCQTTFEMAGPDPDPKGTWDAGRRNSPKDDGYNDFIDWGNNAITNGGNKAGQWRTLTAEEWDYVIRLRDKDKADKRFSLGKVAGVKGLILLPDEWTLPDNLTFVDAQSVGMDISAEGVFSNINESNFELNDYSVAQWQSMQNNGAVFLPAAGSRAETTCSDLGEEGFYWSSTPSEDATAFSLGFTKGIVAPRVTEPRASGQAVRLVYDMNKAPEADDEEDTEIYFTVDDNGKQIIFSPGNLQYQEYNKTKTYRFASAQTEYLGEANKNIGAYQYAGWVDLFIFDPDLSRPGDGSFSFKGELDAGEIFDMPTRKNTPMGDEKEQPNWDPKQPNWDEIVISNGGNKAGVWYPLSADEWNFLFLFRDKATDKFGFATVDGVKGLMILPDNWQLPSECSFRPASSTMTYSDGVFTPQELPADIYVLNTYYSTDQSWQKMEAAGAVFLPAAGGRSKLDCVKLGEAGFYWSCSSDLTNEENVFLVSFEENPETHKLEFRPKESSTWDRGSSYRLVKDYEEEDDVQPFIVTINVAPEKGGEVHDVNDEPIVSAEITFGDILSLTAVANPGYEFEKWEITEEGAPASITSTDNPYPLTASADVTVTAYFTPKYHSLTIEVDPKGSGYVEDIYHIQVADTMLQEGESLILTAIPVDENYTFGRWEYADGDDVVEDGEQITFKMGTTDATIKVYFDQATPTYYTWSIEVNDPDGGMVKQITEAGEEDVTGSQIINLEAGDEVQLKAYANYGYEFEKWVVTDADGTREYGKEENPKTFTVENSDATVTAHFKNILHTLTVVVNNEEGDVVVDNASYRGEDLKEGESVTMKAIPIGGYEFASWDYPENVQDQVTVNGDEITFTMRTEDVTITAHFDLKPTEHVHNWSEPTYTWNDDNSCTASRYCLDDADEAPETETVNGVMTTVPATCTESGSISYTATFVNEAFEEQTSIPITIDALGHDWDNPTYEWTDDHSQCTATHICKRDASHSESETVNAVYATTTKEATCEEAGETTTTYTATFVNKAFNTVEPIVITTPILALGHNPLETVYTWDADYATCTARQVCGNDASHVITETVSATTEAVGGSLMVHTADFTQNDFKDQPFVDQKATCVTMSKYGFLSLYADKAYAVTQGLNALIYTGINGRNLIYQHITVIPAYTGVFFYGEANKTYELVETSTTMTYPDNLLHGTLTTQTIPDNGNVKYILSRLENTDKGGMYWPKGTNRGVGEFMNVGGKAYLEIPSSAGVAPRYFTMRGEACEEVTPVEEAQVDGVGKYYDILGREVREPQAQQIYIRNGKKVLYTK